MAKHHVIIAGFGVPGRSVAELLHSHDVSYCVIELNPSTVDRCAKGGEHIIGGDAREPEVLRTAGIEKATVFVVAVPDEQAALDITKQAHLMNPATRIITRCHFTSKGFEARALGAAKVVIAEQVVAQALFKTVSYELEERG